MVNHVVIPGKPRGYYSVGARPDWKRKNAYHDWCKDMRGYFGICGHDIPFRPTKDRRLFIWTRAWFPNGTHSDPENVHKGLKDALCYEVVKDKKGKPKRKRGGGSDKHSGGCYDAPLYDKANPRLEVWWCWTSLAELLASVPSLSES